MKIQVLGPDINESHLKFSVNKNKDIRFGLGAIKGVGEAAVQSIIQERQNHGPYKDIFDFVERVNLSACNKKNIESLAIAGAFDVFGNIRREQFFAENSKGESFLDILVRYGNKHQLDKAAQTNSLFGDSVEIAIAKPEIPSAPNWTDLERLDKEREVVGIYLSAHPLDEYAIALEYGCNTRMTEMNDKTSLIGRDIVIGGIVTGFREGMGKNGRPYGFLKMEDYSGTAEIALFGEDFINYRKYGYNGMYLLIKGKFQPRRFNEKEFDFKITSIDMLPDVKDKLIDNITISLPLSNIHAGTIDSLQTFLTHRETSKTKLYFEVYDDQEKFKVNLFSRPYRIDVGKELIEYLKENDDLDFKINTQYN